jgi:hypothetical protein
MQSLLDHVRQTTPSAIAVLLTTLATGCSSSNSATHPTGNDGGTSPSPCSIDVLTQGIATPIAASLAGALGPPPNGASVLTSDAGTPIVASFVDVDGGGWVELEYLDGIKSGALPQVAPAPGCVANWAFYTTGSPLEKGSNTYLLNATATVTRGDISPRGKVEVKLSNITYGGDGGTQSTLPDLTFDYTIQVYDGSIDTESDAGENG